MIEIFENASPPRMKVEDSNGNTDTDFINKFVKCAFAGGKKSLNTKKARKTPKMKGGELTMEDPPKEGECIKKGIMGVHTYTVVQVNPSDGNYQPTVDVTDSNGMPHTFNLGEMVRCVAR